MSGTVVFYGKNLKEETFAVESHGSNTSCRRLVSTDVRELWFPEVEYPHIDGDVLPVECPIHVRDAFSQGIIVYGGFNGWGVTPWNINDPVKWGMESQENLVKFFSNSKFREMNENIPFILKMEVIYYKDGQYFLGVRKNEDAMDAARGRFLPQESDTTTELTNQDAWNSVSWFELKDQYGEYKRADLFHKTPSWIKIRIIRSINGILQKGWKKAYLIVSPRRTERGAFESGSSGFGSDGYNRGPCSVSYYQPFFHAAKNRIISREFLKEFSQTEVTRLISVFSKCPGSSEEDLCTMLGVDYEKLLSLHTEIKTDLMKAGFLPFKDNMREIYRALGLSSRGDIRDIEVVSDKWEPYDIDKIETYHYPVLGNYFYSKVDADKETQIKMIWEILLKHRIVQEEASPREEVLKLSQMIVLHGEEVKQRAVF